MFLSVGSANAPGTSQTEVKTTERSVSTLAIGQAAGPEARLRNLGPRPLYIERIELLAASTTRSPHLPGRPSSSGVIHRLSPENAAFFANGWQSWSYTGAYRPGERYRRIVPVMPIVRELEAQAR